LKFDISGADIKELVDRDVEEHSGTGQALDHLFRLYGKIYSENMSDQQREIIDLLVEQGEAPAAEIDAGIVQPLIDITFVQQDDDAGVYRFNGEFLRRVLAERKTRGRDREH